MNKSMLFLKGIFLGILPLMCFIGGTLTHVVGFLPFLIITLIYLLIGHGVLLWFDNYCRKLFTQAELLHIKKHYTKQDLKTALFLIRCDDLHNGHTMQDLAAMYGFDYRPMWRDKEEKEKWRHAIEYALEDLVEKEELRK